MQYAEFDVMPPAIDWVDPQLDGLQSQISALMAQVDMNYAGIPVARVLIGTSLEDRLIGGAGNNVLVGGHGADFFQAGAGRDYIVTDNSNWDGNGDLVYAGSGSDTVYGGVNDQVFGGLGDDFVFGGSHISGGRGNDNLYGDYYGGDAKLVGGGGNDGIFGGFGNNVLYGGAGNDYLLARSGNDTIDGGNGKNTIDAGSGVNLIQLHGTDTIVFNPVDLYDSAFTKIEGAELDTHLIIGILDNSNDVQATEVGDDLLLSYADGRGHVLVENVDLGFFYSNVDFSDWYGGKG